MTKAKRKVSKNMIQQNSDVDYDAVELCWLLKELYEGKRSLGDRMDERLPARVFLQKIIRSGSGLLVSEAVLCKKYAVAVSRIQGAMRSSQDVFFSSKDVPKAMEQFTGTPLSPRPQKKMRETVIASRGSDSWWNYDPASSGDRLQN